MQDVEATSDQGAPTAYVHSTIRIPYTEGERNLKAMNENFRKVGKALIQVRDHKCKEWDIGFTQFLKLCKAELGFSRTRAYDFIAMAEGRKSYEDVIAERKVRYEAEKPRMEAEKATSEATPSLADMADEVLAEAEDGDTNESCQRTRPTKKAVTWEWDGSPTPKTKKDIRLAVKYCSAASLDIAEFGTSEQRENLGFALENLKQVLDEITPDVDFPSNDNAPENE